MKQLECHLEDGHLSLKNERFGKYVIIKKSGEIGKFI
jgi:hypothetical protein